VRTRRVHLPWLVPGETVVRGPEAHHLSRVLRVRPGDPVRAFDGRGLEASGQVSWANEGEVGLELDPPAESEREAPVRVTLAVALLKGDKMSEVVRHGTELGAARFIPVHSARCDVDRLSPNKLSRWRRVAQEAGKQSGRALVPQVCDLVELTHLERGEALGLVADPNANLSLREIDKEHREIILVTGPEGGFSSEEVEGLTRIGFQSVRLGPRILRAETAPVALLAALLLPEAL
jgi:16S rRNA (uracil1498-N3)-methyltransferase